MMSENVNTILDFILLMIQGFSIFFVWYALVGYIDKMDRRAKKELRDPEYLENDADQRIFGIRLGTIFRNIFYAFLISCAAYITITIIQTSEF